MITAQSLSPNFIFWLIGFTEGDGCFGIEKNGIISFGISQSERDLQILLYIQKTLGFGHVTPKNKNKVAKYRVRNQNDLLKIIDIFNGNLYTNKRRLQFQIWLTAFNKKYNENIAYLNYQLKPTLLNAWLSGFTDAEGCFSVSLLFPKKEKNPQIYVRYMLAQETEEALMEEFAVLLKGQKYDGRRLTVNLGNLEHVIAYFIKYKLKTKKAKDFSLWLEVYHLAVAKKHLTPEGVEEIQFLKNQINFDFKKSRGLV